MTVNRQHRCKAGDIIVVLTQVTSTATAAREQLEHQVNAAKTWGWAADDVEVVVAASASRQQR